MKTSIVNQSVHVDVPIKVTRLEIRNYLYFLVKNVRSVKCIISRKVLMTNNERSSFSPGGDKRRGLGPRNDVLTTCKAVNPRASQRPSKAAVCFLMISTLIWL